MCRGYTTKDKTNNVVNISKHNNDLNILKNLGICNSNLAYFCLSCTLRLFNKIFCLSFSNWFFNSCLLALSKLIKYFLVFLSTQLNKYLLLILLFNIKKLFFICNFFYKKNSFTFFFRFCSYYTNIYICNIADK